MRVRPTQRRHKGARVKYKSSFWAGVPQNPGEAAALPQPLADQHIQRADLTSLLHGEESEAGTCVGHC